MSPTYFDPPLRHEHVDISFTYRSENLPNAQSCPDMMEYYGDCFYHPYPAVDFVVPIGTPIYAVANGTVVLVGEETDENQGVWPRRPGRFLVLELDEPLDTGAAFVAYKHLSCWRVLEGQQVNAGKVLGETGNTQVNGTPHLHFDAFTNLAGFNTYEAQADWKMRWVNGQGVEKIKGPSELVMGSWINLSNPL